MTLVVLDASVLAAFLDPEHQRHAAAREALDVAEDVQLVLPATAYAEVLAAVYRESRRAVLRVQARIEELEIIVVPVTGEMAERAAFLRSRRKTGPKLGDLLVIAAGDVLRADAVLTARRTWARYNPRIQVV